MSSDRQETSIPDQRKAVEKWAPLNGYRIVKEYLDEGISGDATDKRHAFQKMIADATSGKFSAIICWDQDRFGRFDSVEAGFWIHPLRAAGVKLVTLNDGEVDWSDFTGRLMYNIKQEGKHQFLRDLARNTARGRHEAAKSGKWMCKPPYGYIKNSNGRLELGDPVEVATVKRVFAEYLKGQSTRSICRTLNAEGVKSPRGRGWQASGVASTLANLTYIGDYVWNAERKGKYCGIVAGELSTDAKRGVTDEGDRIVHRDHHPAMIDRATFKRVQQRLTERKTATTPHRDSGGFLFTSILKCGKCGAAMVGLSRDRKRYNCSFAKHSATCDINTVYQDELAEIVLGKIRERFLDGDTPARLKAELRKQAASTSRKVDAGQLRKQLVSIEGKLTKAKQRLIEVDRDMVSIVQQQIRDLGNQREQLQDAVQAASKPQGQHDADIDTKVDRAFACLFRLPEAFKKSDKAMQREFLQQTIDRIEVVSSRDWSTKRGLFKLQSGVIYLRGELLNNLSIPSECSLRSCG